MTLISGITTNLIKYSATLALQVGKEVFEGCTGISLKSEDLKKQLTTKNICYASLISVAIGTMLVYPHTRILLLGLINLTYCFSKILGNFLITGLCLGTMGVGTAQAFGGALGTIGAKASGVVGSTLLSGAQQMGAQQMLPRMQASELSQAQDLQSVDNQELTNEPPIQAPSIQTNSTSASVSTNSVMNLDDLADEFVRDLQESSSLPMVAQQTGDYAQEFLAQQPISGPSGSGPSVNSTILGKGVVEQWSGDFLQALPPDPASWVKEFVEGTSPVQTQEWVGEFVQQQGKRSVVSTLASVALPVAVVGGIAAVAYGLYRAKQEADQADQTIIQDEPSVEQYSQFVNPPEEEEESFGLLF